MIFVTVGSNTHQFNRLLIAIDQLIENKIIKEKVIAQKGHSDYEPKNYQSYNFLDSEEWEEKIKCSNLVISHSGAGSIMTVLENKKSLIVVPRLEKFGEHVNDHQLDIAKELEKERRILVVYEIKNLGKKIQKAKKNKKSKEQLKKRNEIVEIIDNYIQNLE